MDLILACGRGIDGVLGILFCSLVKVVESPDLRSEVIKDQVVVLDSENLIID